MLLEDRGIVIHFIKLVGNDESRITPSRISAMAGDAVKPGDSMPAAWIKAFWGELMIKSPVLPTARRPQNEVTI